jgi:cytochrome P450 family 135
MSGKLPPGPRFPRIVTLYLTARHTEGTLEYARKRYGDAFTFRLFGGKAIVFTSDPAGVEAVFKARPPVLVPDTSLSVVMGKHSVVVLSGPEHDAARDLLSPPFKKDHVERYRAAIERASAEEFAQWPVGQRFALHPRVQALALRVIVEVIFGDPNDPGVEKVMDRFAECDAYRERNSPITILLMNLGRRRPPEKFHQLFGAFRAELDGHIERSREDPRLAERGDVLAMLLRARHGDGSPFSAEEIRDHVFTIMIQGHTPSSITLAWAMERLVRHPECLAQARDEAGTDRDEYLEAVILETLRLRHPAGAIVGRRVAQPFQLGEYVIDPGVLVGVNAYGLHRREDLYPEPVKFRPERWLEQKPGRYTYTAFGGGDRACIGRDFGMYEVKHVLKAMLREFRFATTDKRGEKSRRRGTTWIPREGAQVVIEERVSARPEQRRPAAAPSASSG